MTPEDRIRALATVDLVELLGEERNELRALLEKGEVGDVERRLGWWEEALGPDLVRAARTAGRAERHPEYRSLEQVFYRNEGPWRSRGLEALRAAVRTGERARFERLKCRARAYARAVVCFLEDVADGVALDERDRGVRGARGRVTEYDYPVFDAHLTYRLSDSSASTLGVEIRRGLHQMERAEQVLAAAAQAEGERDALEARLRELLAQLAEQGAADGEARPDRRRLRQAIREAELVLKRLRQDQDAARIAGAAGRLQEKVREARSAAPALKRPSPV